MIRNFALFATEVIIVIAFIAMLISPILFRSGGVIWGIITRKTIIVASVCYGILLCASWVALSIDNPSRSISGLIFVSGLALIGGIYFIILYLRLPRNTQKYHKLRRDRQKYLHKDKDSEDQ
jgi:ABC-type enterobactin transport system permease subunit